MKKISIWGKNNPKKTIAIIVALHITLQIIAVVLGILLYFNDYGNSKWLVIAAFSVYCIGILFYPIRNSKYKIFAHSYVKQKAFDFVLPVAYILTMTLGINNFFTQSPSIMEQQKLNAPTSRFIVYTPDAKLKVLKAKEQKQEQSEKVFENKLELKSKN